ncbi:hypothetical protein NMY22_g15220 [Coprinellus aureogranulatus]|nr:hypothetical protein NMY22_g15220 [Coprinellus aureogranulatus]
MESTEWFRKCACGQTFYKPNSFSNHINSCKRYKKDLGATLENAKTRYANKAKNKKGTQAIESWYGESSLDVDYAIPQPLDSNMESVAAPEEQEPPPPEGPRGRGFRLWAPTQRYKNFLVTSAIPLAIPMFGEAIKTPPSSPPPPATLPPASAAEEQRRSVLDSTRWRTTEKNGFGLYKVYWTTESLPHDPDLFVSDHDLKDDDLDPNTSIAVSMPANRYHPFPNWSSYALGEWYWDDRPGKSRDSFQHLVDIIANPAFNPRDIQSTNWKKLTTS